MKISPEEARIINERRALKAREKHHEKLKRRALQVALRYQCWLSRKRQGSSYSTFLNSFGYQRSDCSDMFRVVEQIIAAADTIKMDDQPAYEVLKPF